MSAGEPPAVSAQQATPVAKVTFAELYLHPADVDSCCQMAKDRAQSLNTTCDLLTLPTICCLILGKCMEILIKILILFIVGPHVACTFCIPDTSAPAGRSCDAPDFLLKHGL